MLNAEATLNCSVKAEPTLFCELLQEQKNTIEHDLRTFELQCKSKMQNNRFVWMLNGDQELAPPFPTLNTPLCQSKPLCNIPDQTELQNWPKIGSQNNTLHFFPSNNSTLTLWCLFAWKWQKLSLCFLFPSFTFHDFHDPQLECPSILQSKCKCKSKSKCPWLLLSNSGLRGTVTSSIEIQDQCRISSGLDTTERRSLMAFRIFSHNSVD